MAHTIFAEKIFTGETIAEDQIVICEKGKIKSITSGSKENAELQVRYLSAGFNDIHINGGDAHYFTQTPEEKSVRDIALSAEALGTAYTLPTIITSPPETIFRAIEAVGSVMSIDPDSGVMGMHLEGPFLNLVKRGAHLASFLLKPTDHLLNEIISRGRGVIKLMTVAPELFTDRQLDLLLESGITISAGHSNATYAEAQHAFGRGVRLVTHLFNAMSGFGHRAPGLVGATLDRPDVYAPVILDGAHCDFAAARLAWKLKREKLFLISDALFTGGKVQHFQWGEYDAQLIDGKYVNSEGNLAGATISMGDAVRNAVREVGIGLQEAVEMATIRPAAALGLSDVIGKVKQGYPATFTAFDDTLHSFKVIKI